MLLLTWLSPSADAQPANDNCAAAAIVGPGSTTFSTIGATTDGPDEPGPCTIGNYTQIGNDIWFRYTSGPCNSAPTTIRTCGSSFDTKIAVYITDATGACPTDPCFAFDRND